MPVLTEKLSMNEIIERQNDTYFYYNGWEPCVINYDSNGSSLLSDVINSNDVIKGRLI